jgi:RNA polymerase sigma-70 factor (ECF subfamily)
MSTAAAEIPVHPPALAVESRALFPVDTTSPLSDHELMIAVRDGELDAMGELFERHHGPLFGYLTKLTGNRTAAEDILQNVFQRMLKYRHTYRDEGSFTAWMYHLGRRCSSDYFRKASAAPLPVDPVDLESQADEGRGADESAAASDDQALLRRALDRLDRDDREVLLLSRLQELSFAEVATILECSVGAARVRAHRALRTLRDHYFQLQRESPT